MINQDFMMKAIQIALQNEMETPVGHLVQSVKEGEFVRAGQNLVTEINVPTAHAEIQAIREALSAVKYLSA